MHPGFYFIEYMQQLSELGLSSPDPLEQRLAQLPGTRSLTPAETDQLTGQGCTASDWSGIRITDTAPQNSLDSLQNITNTSFSGTVVLNWQHTHEPPSAARETPADSLPDGIHNCRLHNCCIAATATAIDCPLLSGVLLGDHSLAFNSCIGSIRTTPGSENSLPFGIGTPLELLNEAAPSMYLLRPTDTLPEITSLLDDDNANAASTSDAGFPALPAGLSILARQAAILHTSCADDIYLDPGCSIHNATEVTSAVLLSTLTVETSGTRSIPSSIGSGSIVRRSALQPGSRIDTQARVFSSLILETGGAESSALIKNSIIGPGSVIAQGEVTASIAGPLIGQHHQSLLIAADWRHGLGNIGYGANVGSNHSSRLADKSILIGEGCFFGLDSAIQFPTRLDEAPYTIIATSTVLPPQRISLPFSLIIPGHDRNRGINRIIPAWTLHSNLFSVMRNWHKYQARHTALLHHLNPFPMRKTHRSRMQHSIDQLKQLTAEHPNQTAFTSQELPGLGANILYQKDIQPAIAAYSEAIQFGILYETPSAELTQAQRSQLKHLLESFIDRVRTSRLKDQHLHQHIFDSTPPEDTALSAVIAPLQKQLDQLS